MAFAAATAVRQVSSHTYTANFVEDWCIGSVPHGGVVSSTIQNAVNLHFNTTLKKQNQPHNLALHLDFLRRTDKGEATITIKDVKLGRQTSVVQVTLSQGDREEVVGYVTNTNLATEEGISYNTNWTPYPKRVPLSSTTSALEGRHDPAWGELKEWPNQNFRKATGHIRSFFPTAGQLAYNIYDQWICLRDPSERWTNDKLGYLVDTFPQVPERFVLDGLDQYHPSLDIKKTKHIESWYPTLLLNLDVKKALPAEGVKFLFSRLQTKAIKNGRYDLEIVIMDEGGDIVALSHHVCFVVSAERNTSARRKPDATKL